MNKITAVAALALVSGAVLIPGPANADTIGTGISLGTLGGYLGDLPESYSQTGDAPISAGASAAYSVLCQNGGDVNEDLSISDNPGIYFQSTLAPLPASWITASPTTSSNVVPGDSFVSTVTIAIPADTVPGLYVGILYCDGGTAGSTVAAGSGTGLREYVSVVPAP
jgi:hypothetical protein